MIGARNPAIFRLTRPRARKTLPWLSLSYPLITDYLPRYLAKLLPFWPCRAPVLHSFFRFSSTLKGRGFVPLERLSNIIVMDHRTTKGPSLKAGVRNRRYAIRYPFAADVELIDLETGTTATSVTSDISLGGCFVCTSKPFSLKSRARVTLTRKGQTVKGLAVVRIVKPRIGMGIEFIDIESAGHDMLSKWIEQMRER